MAHVHPHRGHLLRPEEITGALPHLADNANVDACLCSQVQQTKHLCIRELRIVDGKRLLRVLEEGCEAAPARYRG